MIGILRNELKHFRALSKKAQILLISYALQGMADPFIKIFLNAYIWQSNKNPLSVILYNMGDFLILPFIFVLNGFFLKKIKAHYLYFMGAVGIGMSALFVLFYTWFDPIAFLLYGCIYGVGHGFYWANRNLLSLQETESKTRNYFTGLNLSIDFITSIFVPLIAGWFIGFGMRLHIIRFQTSYIVLMLFAFFLLVSAGVMLITHRFEKEVITRLHLVRVTQRWAKVRLLMVGFGMAGAANFFLPTVLILMNLGKEEILGTLTAFASLICAIGMYLFGRYAGVHHRKQVLIASIIFGLITTGILAFCKTKFGILFFITFNSLTVEFAGLAGEPLILDIVDTEHTLGANDNYAFVIDRELFLNIGRISIYLICILLFNTFGMSYSFFFFPLISWIVLAVLSLFTLREM